MNVGISPAVGKHDFSAIGFDVREGVQNVPAVQIMKMRRRNYRSSNAREIVDGNE